MFKLNWTRELTNYINAFQFSGCRMKLRRGGSFEMCQGRQIYIPQNSLSCMYSYGGPQKRFLWEIWREKWIISHFVAHIHCHSSAGSTSWHEAAAQPATALPFQDPLSASPILGPGAHVHMYLVLWQRLHIVQHICIMSTRPEEEEPTWVSAQPHGLQPVLGHISLV